VNRALFGFQTVEDYERFLEMLHVVRTPKLGEGLNPKKVEAYLKESLPPIQSAAIENASEVFSKLDSIEERLEQVASQLAAARALEPAQEAAVLAAARQAAAVYRESAREHRGRKRAHEKLLNDLDAARAEVARQQEVRAVLAAERAERRGRLAVLQEQYRTHGAFDLEGRLKEVCAEHREAAAAYEALREDRRRTQKAVDAGQVSLRDTEQSWTRRRARLTEKLEAVAAAARRGFWPSLEQRAGLAKDGLEGMGIDGGGTIASDLARSVIEGEVEQRRGVLAAIQAAHEAAAAATGRLDAARKASDVARREYTHADERFRTAARDAESARTAASAALTAWRMECAELWMADEPFGEVLAGLETYDPHGRRPAAPLAPLQPTYDDAGETLRSRAQELEIRRRRVRDDADEVDARLKRLAAEPDVEPERTPAQAAARRLLREHGIPHLPLFAACDLGGPLVMDAALAARVEAALLDAGLLDALVVPSAEAGRVRALLDAHGLGDRWIAPAPGADEGIEDDWLVPVASAELSAADVRAAFASLGLGGGAGVVDADGGWRLGPLHGVAPVPAEARVRFLGETARREERRRRIEEARQRLAELREQLGTLGEEIEAVHARERTLAREWRAAHELPHLQALHDRLLAMRREEQERERRRGIADLAAEAVEGATREVQQKAAALDRATEAAPYLKGRARADVDAVAAALAEVLGSVRAVGDDVERMDEIRRDYTGRTRALDALRLQAEELAPRIAQADARLQTLDAQIRTLEAQLSQAAVGRSELAAEIEILDRRLEEIEKADRAAHSAIDKSSGHIESLTGQEPDLRDQLRGAFIRLQADENVFRTRLEAYPTLEEFLAALRESGPDRAMQLIMDEAGGASVDEEASRAREELRTAFLQASGSFEEMSPSLDGDVVRFAHEHGPMRLDELYRALEDEQARNETLLEEEDRKLIEQLMLRDVVDAIRDAIRNTKRWVEEINATLGGMQLFKGGIMRLQWAVRTREAADAFDPRRLDDLLTQRGVALNETRREELLEIFRTMVADVRRRNRERELLEDYRTALLRMVDYTQWYTLTVQRKDETGRWMPLTRRLYGQGSGGRRTLDLLLPLVAAVSARLASANHDAPRLVGFDEAFAGVDDRNAAEIYGLLTELGFCWIMATEKVAGVGAQVRGSATYEMLTDGVTVAPTLSLWDGERRYEFVGDELLTVELPSRRAVERDHAS
ncbi:MAG TPA: SbcC/MukB-like Walker B domain-containing protein, partial [Longimicrobium sp.]